MKIKTTWAGEPWRATPTSDPLYTITLEGYGEPQKTYDQELTVIGEHEAEQYTSKTGKSYWRAPGQAKAYVGKAKEFKADPVKLEQDKSLAVATNMSIQRQVGLKATVDLIVAGKVEYANLYETYTALMGLLSEPDWHKFETSERTERDLLPTDDEVDNLTGFEDAFAEAQDA